MALNRLRLLLKRSFHPLRIEAAFPDSRDGVTVSLGGPRVLPMRYRYRFLPEAAGILEQAASAEPRPGEEDLTALATVLEACLFEDLREEAETLISLLAGSAEAPTLSGPERAVLQRRILWLLHKYAHRKYRESFEATVGRLRNLLEVPGAGEPGGAWEVVAKGLPAIVERARARFEG